MPRDHACPDRGRSVAAPEGAVEAEQTRLLLQNPVDVPAKLINAGLVGVIVWPLYPAWVLAVWLGSVCTLSLASARMRDRCASASDHAKSSSNWAGLFVGIFHTRAHTGRPLLTAARRGNWLREWLRMADDGQKYSEVENRLDACSAWIKDPIAKPLS